MDKVSQSYLLDKTMGLNENNPSQITISGVIFKHIQEIPVKGGPVLHMIKSSDPDFLGFGEVYFSLVEPHAVKAWKRHTKQTQQFAVPHGCISVVLYDDRKDSPTKGQLAKYLLGRPEHYALLRIPPLVWYGFGSNCKDVAVLANCVDIPHVPHESERLPLDSSLIPFSWSKE